MLVIVCIGLPLGTAAILRCGNSRSITQVSVCASLSPRCGAIDMTALVLSFLFCSFVDGVDLLLACTVATPPRNVFLRYNRAMRGHTHCILWPAALDVDSMLAVAACCGNLTHPITGMLSICMRCGLRPKARTEITTRYRWVVIVLNRPLPFDYATSASWSLFPCLSLLCCPA